MTHNLEIKESKVTDIKGIRPRTITTLFHRGNKILLATNLDMFANWKRQS